MAHLVHELRGCVAVSLRGDCCGGIAFRSFAGGFADLLGARTFPTTAGQLGGAIQVYF